MDERKPTVLIAARDQAVAFDVATLVRSVDCIAWFPGTDETIVQAMVRLRPGVLMVDADRPDVDLDRVSALAGAVGSHIVLFGDEAPRLREIAKERGLRSVALDAPARAFGYAIQEAVGA